MGKHKGSNYNGGFALIVVLFILLIIVGAIYRDDYDGHGYC